MNEPTGNTENPVNDHFDLPLGNLPPIGRVELTRDFVVAASAEVRFSGAESIITREIADAIREGIGAEILPQIEESQLNLVNFVITPNGATQQTDTQQGWKLWSHDRRTSVTLLPTTVIVETAGYRTFSASLGGLFKKATSHFAEKTGATLVQRIGLRYVNQLFEDAAETPAWWASSIRPEFAGVLAGEFSELVTEARQLAVLRLNETSSSRVNTAIVRDNPPRRTYSFVIDVDVFREQAMDFEKGQVSDLARQLNRTALSLFARVLTDEYFDGLKRNEDTGE